MKLTDMKYDMRKVNKVLNEQWKHEQVVHFKSMLSPAINQTESTLRTFMSKYKIIALLIYVRVYVSLLIIKMHV